MFRTSAQLSPRLYGFMPGRSTHHCFAEYFVNSSPGTQTVFIDLKSAFDIANKEVILEQLAQFGVRGKLLTWIKLYLSNRSASVMFRGVRSAHSRSFDLGTPQGGVLSPMLFNILMHKLISDLPLHEEDTLICYADDICLKSKSESRMQTLLDAFATKATECGLVISTDKTKALNPRTIPLPNYTIDGGNLDLCHQYKYLGVYVNDPEFILNLKKRLQERLKPLKVLVGRNHGINIRYSLTFNL